ncbi:Uncharacterized protein OBRU01_26595 [Operophtera brumata]|uniref:Uncharacterized protein n=1 Tax=Operophtera brumata TaxID=104452 RepID=A0A0L7K2J0_OPEBR|nr:Uncharacterized protein OBRU01_26595 [Operophtera brumata]
MSVSFTLAMCIPKPCTTELALSTFFFNVSAIGFQYTDTYCRLSDDKPWSPADSPSATLYYDNMMSEIYERSQRERNIIIIGVDEIKATNSEERRNYDNKEVNQVLKAIVPDCIQPKKVFRLGKYTDGKPRPIKACFETSEIAKSILRNKSKTIPPTIHFILCIHKRSTFDDVHDYPYDIALFGRHQSFGHGMGCNWALI